MLKKDKGGKGGGVGSEQREETLIIHTYSIRDSLKYRWK